jgi:hypothetical protein
MTTIGNQHAGNKPSEELGYLHISPNSDITARPVASEGTYASPPARRLFLAPRWLEWVTPLRGLSVACPGPQCCHGE